MRRITTLERQIIEVCLARNKSHRRIAWILGRDRRVIDREVDRNKPEDRAYRASLADRLAQEREAKRCKKKLEKDEPLRSFVVDRLKEDFSPEQIAGILKEEPPEDLKDRTITHESIYQYIYEGEGRYEALYHHLRRHRKQRRPRGRRQPQKITILERISIHDRPKIIDDKKRLGDFECDLVEGPRCGKQALSVHYERRSQHVNIYRVKNKKAEETNDALLSTREKFPEGFMRSVTFDNGSETARHHLLRYEYDVDTFHCDPYASWQKGGVENVNGLIRQYIPKGTRIEDCSDELLRLIETRLNNRPRKTLNYKTPNQVLAQSGVGH